jgi:hypothetical protein
MLQFAANIACEPIWLKKENRAQQIDTLSACFG